MALGLAGMSTARSDVYEQLKSNLYLDDAVAGEAAGIAMGLVMLGTKSAGAIEDMVTVSYLCLNILYWINGFCSIFSLKRFYDA